MSSFDELALRLRELAPDLLEAALLEWAERAGNAIVRIAFAGAFSTGKSSLINMLIGEELLAAGLEETTSTPVYIERGNRAICVEMADGRRVDGGPADIRGSTLRASSGAVFVAVTLPLSWLDGLCIVDIPGSGGVSAKSAAYASAQVRNADAIVYLLPPRGPSVDDLSALTTIRQVGKRVKVMVSQWDVVESAIASGETAPSLEAWASQIELRTGLRTRVGRCSRAGLGREEILDYLRRVVDERDQIRVRQLKAELKPLLSNALAANDEARRVAEATSEQQVSERHFDLLERKLELHRLKQSLHEEQAQERIRILDQGQSDRVALRGELAVNLEAAAEEFQIAWGWDDFTAQGSDLTTEYLVQLAARLSELSRRDGQMAELAAAAQVLRLQFPEPPTIEVQDFLDVGAVAQLQEEVQRQEALIVSTERALTEIPVVDMGPQEKALRALLQERHALASAPLPKILRELPSAGAAWGRLAGEVADIGLIFVDPRVAAAKIAALMGRGAKAMRLPVDRSALASSIERGIHRTKEARLGEWLSKVSHRSVNKLRDLESFSLGYWGERLGRALGGGVLQEVVDPAAEYARNQQLAELESRIHALRRQIVREEDIANERDLAGAALRDSLARRDRLNEEIEQQLAETAQRRQEAEEEARRVLQEHWKRHAEHAVERWLRSYDRQASHMISLLDQHSRAYWDGRVAEAVNDRAVVIDRLLAELAAGPGDRSAALELLNAEASRIRQALTLLTPDGAE